ncbi:Zn-ribbon domain-containing OB-fold protein [Sinimarinibacterium flocculans]|uniref:Zn-ribbon domain-containing OB-fold protein n=1 Tax=Sinimarinibacterium flocculans TaxID=985250 RepID=UPI002491AA0D|nr:OB-fold domain-containing protein [Sinimarinibacterium flocculans]
MSMERIAIPRPRAYPPRVTEFTLPYWQALAAGRLQTTQCLECGALSYPPKPICPHCWCDRVEWQGIDPQGALYSWTRVHAGPEMFAAEIPYDVGIVDLDAGLRVALRLVARSDRAFDVGMRMRLVVLDFADGPLLAARPA